MQDKFRTKEQLVNELTFLRKRVAELEKSQSEIKQAEEKYKNIFENCMEGIFQITPEGRFMGANPAAALLLGYDSPEELINNVTDLASQVYVNPEDRDKVVQLLKAYGIAKNIEMK